MSRIARVLFLCLVTTQAAHATVRHVPSQYPTIMRAITVSVDGDTVLVAPGTYVENVDFQGKAITVTSSGGPGATRIAAPSSGGSVVTFDSGEGPDSVLSGFTIRDGEGTISALTAYGGGIYCWGASPTILDNIITNNQVGPGALIGLGGGLYLQDSDAILRGNVISNNTAATDGGGLVVGPGAAVIESNTIRGNLANNAGGGIDCWGNIFFPCLATFQDNTIETNTAGFGGGLWISIGATPRVVGNAIVSNDAWSDGGGIHCSGDAFIQSNTIQVNHALGYGGGVACAGGSPNLSRNIINDNASDSSFGGGLYLNGCTATLTNNMIYRNIAVLGNGRGGGLYSDNAVVMLLHNTVFGNIAWSNGGGISYTGTAPTLENSIVWGNSSLNTNDNQLTPGMDVTFSDVEGGYPGVGNIDAYPEFVHPAPGNEDLHLRIESPCINAGNNAAAGLPSEDFEGETRMAHGTVDMGADEYVGCMVLMTPFGTGLAGSGGFVPELSGSGRSCAAGGHTIHIRDALGSTSGHLWVGTASSSVPFLGGTLYIDLVSPWVIFPIAVGGSAGVPGAGFLDVPGSDVSGLVGVSLFLQVSLLDPGAPNGASLSNALELEIADM